MCSGAHRLVELTSLHKHMGFAAWISVDLLVRVADKAAADCASRLAHIALASQPGQL